VGLEKKTNDRTVQWFQRHRNHLNEFSVDARAVVMFFTPAKQTDRDYGLDAERLEQLIARVLGLSRNLHTELQMWRSGPAHGDLGACVKRVMEKMTSVWYS
jgi:DNA ligase-4